MALTEEMKRQISEDAGVKDAFKKGDTKAAKILADLGLVGLSFLPIGAAIRGGTLVYKGLRGAKAAAELRKVPKVASALKAPRPALKSAPKVKPGASVQTGKPSPLAKPKPQAQAKPKPAEKPKPAQATTSGTRGKPTGGTGRAKVQADRKPVRAERKPVKAERKPVRATTKVTKRSGPATRGSRKPAAKRGLTKRDAALGAAATLGGAGTIAEGIRRGGKADADTKRKPSGPATRGSRKPPSKKAAPKATPKGMGDRKSAPKKVTPTKKAAPKGMADRKSAERKAVTAGKNVGFGPKGNIFPKNAEDRTRLMRLYGGTGSAAAKAAAAGKQGTLKKGKK